MTKRIVRAFKLNEISAVDAPAQEGARALIMKAAHQPLMKANSDVITFAKAFRRDPALPAAQQFIAKVRTVLKGEQADGFITAADVYRFMLAYALAKKTEGETLALAWGRLLIHDKVMMSMYAAHQQLILMGRKGDPVPDTISEADAREVHEPADAPDEAISVSDPETDKEQRKQAAYRSY